MKYFASTSTRLFTVRKEGYKPSSRTALQLKLRLQVVMQWSEIQSDCAQLILENGLPSWEEAEKRYGHLSHQMAYGVNPYTTFPASELSVLEALISWWTMDSPELRDERCFTVVDLNRGISLCIVSK